MKARHILGLTLIGYGLLVLLELVAHEARWVGVTCTALGVIVLASTLRSGQADAPAESDPHRASDRSAASSGATARATPGAPFGVPVPLDSARFEPIVAVIGLVSVVGVLTYNVVVGFELGLPEVALLLYGVALALCAPHLDRPVGHTKVGTLVAWSFPVLLAPLLVFALNAALSGPLTEAAGAAARPLVIHSMVLPMAALLRWTGTPNQVVGDNIIMETGSGSLALGIGLVCSGLYPMVLFAGLLGLHGWRERLSARRFWSYLAVGLTGLFLVNLVRLVLLAKVGLRWGGVALQQAHAHLGWLLFIAFMVLFWGVLLRWVEPWLDRNGGTRATRSA